MRYWSEAFILPCRARPFRACRGSEMSPARRKLMHQCAFADDRRCAKAPARAKKNGRWLERPKLPKEEDENMEPDVLSMLS